MSKKHLHHNSIFIKSIQDSDKNEFLEDLESLKNLYSKFLSYLEFKPWPSHNQDDEYYKRVARKVHSPLEPLLEKEISEDYVDGEDKLSREDLFQLRFRHLFPVNYHTKDPRVNIEIQGIENKESYDVNAPYGKIEGILDVFDKLTTEFSRPTSLEEVRKLKMYIDTINELVFILHKMYYVTGFYPDVAIDLLLVKLSTLKENGITGMDATLTNRYVRSICEEIKHLNSLDKAIVEDFIVRRLDNLTRKKTNEQRETINNACFLPNEKCEKSSGGVYTMNQEEKLLTRKENFKILEMEELEKEDKMEENLNEYEVKEIETEVSVEEERRSIREEIDKRISKSRIRTALTVLGVASAGVLISILAVKFKEKLDSESITDFIKQI